MNDVVRSEGVFIGLWEPKDRKRGPLGKTFKLYAAPCDLGLDNRVAADEKRALPFKDTLESIACLQNLLAVAHEGAAYQSDVALYDAIREDQYNGEWFLPPEDALRVLYKSKDKDLLRGTFAAVAQARDELWYWSSTMARTNPPYASAIRFTDGEHGWGHMDHHALSARLVRAEPVIS